MGSSRPQKQLNVLLFGLGAIGGFYAYVLGRNQNVSLSVIARSNHDAVKENGLQIESEIHGSHKVNIDHVYRSPSDAVNVKFDYIVCAHKAIKPASIPSLFKAVTDDNTTFVIIQNGVGNEEPFRDTFARNTIISCVTWTGAVQKIPGVISHNRNEDMQIGLFPNKSIDQTIEQKRLTTFSELLTNGGTKFSVEEDVQVKRWEKVVWNAAWNPLTTITGLPVQAWLKSSPEAEALTRQLMEDVITVGRRLGVPLKDGLAAELLAKVVAMQSPIFSSMYQDAQAGRPLETDVIVGFPMRKANELGLDVPGLRAIYALTTAVNARLTEAKL
ncbi:Putative ketopantoate reductase ApbA/PanE, 6-phosphogluconate dehydrogenase-like domain superfamily [Septoria linicola]|uniref:2-dehydropantoate 2-reductase n=1 Tax=Septoria linicola TaxID=215465 RepID=A0A9Q9ANG9_9PEZI|nr:Putative ketopantoate reductase ApbA/PanE, 6-phosphogluconate dehydrogenase-like domain superfamily [Septoria linicola]